LDLILRGGGVQVAVVPVDWRRFLETYAGGRRPAWLSEFQRATPQQLENTQRDERARPLAAAASEPPRPSTAIDYRSLPPAKRRQALRRLVQEQSAAVLGLTEAAELDPSLPLNEQGVDSLISVELRNRLGKAMGLPRGLPATLVFDYPTIEKLVEFLDRHTLPASEQGPAPADLVTAAAGDDLIDAIGRLTDEEADRLLKQREEGR
jgi:acyl carrier protein